MQKITPCLWFDMNCEEAINFYISVFSGNPAGTKGESKIESIMRYPDGPLEGPIKDMEGKILTAIFLLEGRKFMALDGGPIFKFNESISLQIECGSQEEVDYFWEKMSAHKENEQCGWIKDKFGLSWQIIPTRLGELLQDKDKVKAKRVLDAMMEMKKIDIAKLQEAYDTI